VRGGCSRSFGFFVSGSSCLFKQVKGWRRFTVADGVFVRRIELFPPDLSAAEPDEREKGTPASTEHPPVMSPGDRGPLEKDRPIVPTSGRNPEPLSSLGKRAGASPSFRAKCLLNA
jgi:hypothetical protein